MDTELERPRWRSTANVRVLPSLQLGAEFNPAVGEVAPLATWFLRTEGERTPAVFVGTSSDRIGSPEGTQAYYLTVAKYAPPLRSSLHASAHYSEWEERVVVPFGASIELGGGFLLQPLYDGNRTHLMASYAGSRYSVTAIAAWMERAGLAVSFGF